MENNETLGSLTKKISRCRVCIENPLGAPLPHEPRPVLVVSEKAKIAICGQAPGTRVHASGIPFTDPSGDRLREWLGVDEIQFYNKDNFSIIPMGFCFPGLTEKGADKPPRRECALNWRTPLMRLLPQFELVLVIGMHAQAWHLNTLKHKTLRETVADWQRIYTVQDSPRLLPMPHPSWRNNAWLKFNPWFEKDLLPVLKSDVQKLLNR